MLAPSPDFRVNFHIHFSRYCRVAGLTLACLTGGMGLLPAIGLAGQSPASQAPASQDLQAQLRIRVEAVRAAHGTDPARASQAAKQLIAVALRALAQLRLVEFAFPESAQLYQRSLDFQDLPETRVDLAIAQVGEFEADAALANIAHAAPGDPRAAVVAGRAWMIKRDYTRAAEYLAKVAAADPSLENLYNWASCALASKDSAQRAQAGETFQRIVREYGESGSVHVMFGRAYREAQDMPSAVREFQRALAIDPRTPHAHYFLGLALLAINEWAPTEESRAQFLAELENYPRDYLANYMLGYVDSVSHRTAEATPRLRVATEVDPSAPDPWLYLGLNAFSAGDTAAAEKDLRKAIELTGNDEDRAVFQVRKAYITLGRILVSTGRREEGEKLLAKGRQLQNKVLALSQQSIGTHLIEGGAGVPAVVIPPDDQRYLASGKAQGDIFAAPDPAVLQRSGLTEAQRRQAESAEKTFRTLLALGFSELGASEAALGVYRSAVGRFQEAARWDPGSPGVQRSLGLAAYRAGDFAEATRALQLALQENSKDAPARALLGISFFSLDRYHDAVAALTPLGEAGMRDPLAGYAWAASLVRLGDLKQAGVVLTALQQNPLPPETMLLVAQLWVSVEDYQHAIEAADRALAAKPGLAGAHSTKGLAYLRWDRHQQAAQEFAAELAVNPGDLDAKNNLGFLYLESSRTDDARKLFNEVLAASPANPVANYQLGKILLDEGRVEDAISHLETAARGSPDTDYVHYQLQAAYRKAGRNTDADRELQTYKDIKARKRAAASPAGAGENP